MASYDVIVIGLGGMGSAVLCHLAERGVRVLGIEPHGVAHDRGSSHGESRIIRKVYFEHADYVPLLRRAYALWGELEARSGQELFRRIGLLEVGDPAGAVLTGVKRSAAIHGLAVEPVPIDELSVWFPGFRGEDGLEAVYEADAGFLHVERCVTAHVDRARDLGATTAFGETVRQWSARPGGVSVLTDHHRHEAGALAICAGPWSLDLLQALGLPLHVRRKPVFWFQARAGAFALDRGCPVFCYDTADGFYYGCPGAAGGEIKVAEHSGGERIDHADRLDRSLRPEDPLRVRSFAERFLPGLTQKINRHSVCMYTMTPDEHFVIDRHPEHGHVVLAAGFSGHGFKFAPVVGSALADLLTSGRTPEPIGFLSMSRFAGRNG